MHIQQALLVVSLLEDIPVDLAVKLTGVSSIGVDLSDLARRNYFIRSLSQDKTSFCMHHLFQDFLRDKVMLDFTSEQIQQIYQQAGEYCFRYNNIAQSLSYLLRAKDYDSVELVLKESGMTFLATNQTATLSSLLQQIPTASLHSQGWSCFFWALATLDSAPANALPLLEIALQVFSRRQDKVGEMISLAHMISIHVTTTGHYREGEESLYRAEELFFQIDDDLDPATTILVVYSLAIGYCIFLADIDKATRYSSLGLSLAHQEKLVNLEAAMLMIKGYIEIFAGRTSLAFGYLEQAAPYVYRPEVGMFNSLAIRMMLFNFLFHNGDFVNYFDQKNLLIDAVGNPMISQSIAGPFCYVWEMDIAINQGKYEKSLELAHLALNQRPLLTPHMRGQILQLRAVVHALKHDYDIALIDAEESLRLREQAGGQYFITLNNILVGLAVALSGQQEYGLKLLGGAIDTARQMPTEYLEACGLLHRATIHLKLGNDAMAVEDISLGLRLMRRNNYLHFWGWNPEAIEEVLTIAAIHQIEFEYARVLAAECINMSLLDVGRAVPQLVIRTLGGCTIEYCGKILLQPENFTPLQRELLCLLFVAPGLKLSQETIQLHFWPDSSAHTAKMKFDTMVSRLRKTIANALSEDIAFLYINREKGMLWLANCRVDALEFLSVVKRAQEHLRLQEHWQAGNNFALALKMWQGEFLPGVSGDSNACALRTELVKSLSSLVIMWSDLLVKTGRVDYAITVTERALLSDPLNEKLYSILYRLEGRSSSVRAFQVKKRFTSVLLNEGYALDEIDELVTGITA